MPRRWILTDTVLSRVSSIACIRRASSRLRRRTTFVYLALVLSFLSIVVYVPARVKFDDQRVPRGTSDVGDGRAVQATYAAL